MGFPWDHYGGNLTSALYSSSFLKIVFLWTKFPILERLFPIYQRKWEVNINGPQSIGSCNWLVSYLSVIGIHTICRRTYLCFVHIPLIFHIFNLPSNYFSGFSFSRLSLNTPTLSNPSSSVLVQSAPSDHLEKEWWQHNTNIYIGVGMCPILYVHNNHLCLGLSPLVPLVSA